MAGEWPGLYVGPSGGLGGGGGDNMRDMKEGWWRGAGGAGRNEKREKEGAGSRGRDFKIEREGRRGRREKER